MVEGLPHDVGGMREGAGHVAPLLRMPREHVAVDALVERRRAGSERRVDAGQRGPRLVLDPDELGGVRGHVRASRGHHGHRLAREPDAGGRERRPRGGREAGGGQARSERAHVGEVTPRQHRGHARHGARRLRVHAHDARMGVRAPHERGVEQAGRTEVVEVAAASGEETRVLHALDRGAHPARRRQELRPGAGAHERAKRSGPVMCAGPILLRFRQRPPAATSASTDGQISRQQQTWS